jgi:hypothetical protein
VLTGLVACTTPAITICGTGNCNGGQTEQSWNDGVSTGLVTLTRMTGRTT